MANCLTCEHFVYCEECICFIGDDSKTCPCENQEGEAKENDE